MPHQKDIQPPAKREFVEKGHHVNHNEPYGHHRDAGRRYGVTQRDHCTNSFGVTSGLRRAMSDCGRNQAATRLLALNVESKCTSGRSTRRHSSIDFTAAKGLAVRRVAETTRW